MKYCNVHFKELKRNCGLCFAVPSSVTLPTSAAVDLSFCVTFCGAEAYTVSLLSIHSLALCVIGNSSCFAKQIYWGFLGHYKIDWH